MGLPIIKNQNTQANSVLAANTIAFTACFAVWVMFSVIGIPIKELLSLNNTQFGVLVATPILTGSLFRLPVGMMTDKFGGRIVYFILLLTVLTPLWFIGSATQYWQFLILGLLVGVAGASFTVGIAYTAKWFDRKHQGFAMGIFGAGNAGAAITNFVAPVIVASVGWQMVPKIYAIAMMVVVILYWMFTYTDPDHSHSTKVTIKEQLQVLKNPKVWKYMQYYSLVFGGFVGLSLWMTKYYINEYGFDLKDAALLGAIFVLPSGVIRALGGWFSDKFGPYKVTWWVMWVSLVCLFFMSYPQTALLIKTTAGDVRFDIGLNIWVFTALLFTLGISWGIGKASVFKFLSDEFPENIGVVSGIVGLAGGMGGFILPIMFGALIDFTGINSVIFMLLYGATAVSLIWMHFTFGKDERAKNIKHAVAEASNK
ncbi:MFS transporter [Bathymodiolus septemdierum thioautotrophic gill symbiont]|uniref:MFS transporter, NNP family, nitrate/nitrite transporter n=1 Tax=endosymbiont of Bathymodiolus septemdierum str. Myojin knoll TaxID=1303921 RepID=A0A0P0UQ66_9GAMM|nr:nitrate/nitrite transporter [Bathymodiolus septemdierum thioautotrophic gill symbiont]BAS67110.1 MFS transporter, NNP family, nitrate/nitrite transporter [endosymbiont of Bathymodiolus septemdierum str. Myojin knoll]